MSVLKEIAQAVIEGRADEVEAMAKQALEEGIEPQKIINDGLMRGMEVVGERFASEEMFIPEVMLSAKCMHNALGVLRPLLEDRQEATGRGKVILGTVEGDIHDIGKKLVEMMFTANGFHVVDLGINVSPANFVKAIKEQKPMVVGMSALLTTTMKMMEKTIEEITRAGLRDNIKIIVGGAPVTEEFARDIGADLYGENALEAVKAVMEAIKE